MTIHYSELKALSPYTALKIQRLNEARAEALVRKCLNLLVAAEQSSLLDIVPFNSTQ
jgi:hypothetical protein